MSAERVTPFAPQDSPGAINVQGGPAPLLVQIDKGIGKQFVSAIYFSSWISAAAAVCLLFMLFAWRDAARDARVTEDELLRLRATMQAAGMPIPDPEEN